MSEIKTTTFATLFSHSCALNLELYQVDVKTVFLHGDLNEELYVKQQEGFIILGIEQFVCKLKWSIYGRQWLFQALSRFH